MEAMAGLEQTEKVTSVLWEIQQRAKALKLNPNPTLPLPSCVTLDKFL
jgi:hypothetical protein